MWTGQADCRERVVLSLCVVRVSFHSLPFQPFAFTSPSSKKKKKKNAATSLTTLLYKGACAFSRPRPRRLSSPFPGGLLGHRPLQQQLFALSLARHSGSVTFTSLTCSDGCGQVLLTPSPPRATSVCVSNSTVQTFEQLAKDTWGLQGSEGP